MSGTRIRTLVTRMDHLLRRISGPLSGMTPMIGRPRRECKSLNSQPLHTEPSAKCLDTKFVIHLRRLQRRTELLARPFQDERVSGTVVDQHLSLEGPAPPVEPRRRQGRRTFARDG